MLRRVGDLTLDEARLRADDADAWLEQLGRRAPRRSAAGRRRAALDRRRGRRPVPRRARLGAAVRPARGVPRGRAERDGAARAPLRAHPRAVRGGRAEGALRARPHARAGGPRARRRAGARRAASGRHASASGATPRCCGGCGAPRSQRCARRSSLPTSARSRASCRAGRASTAIPPRARGSTACATCSCRCRGSRCPSTCGSATCCRGAGAYSPSWLDQLCAAGELVWVGAGPLGRRSGRVALYFREDAALLGAPPAPPAPEGGVHDALRARLAAGACFFTDLLTDVPGVPTEELVEALWDLVWAGEATNDAWAPLRSPKLTAAAPWSQKARAERRRSFSRPPARRPADGAGPLVADRGRCSRRTIRPRAGAPRPSCCSSATASSRASRCSPRASRAASRRCTTRSSRWRRSASPAAATSSRGSAARSSPCPARSSACARSATTTRRRRSCSPPPTRRSRTGRR